MKKLFKNLMLVAVAAMGFTACTETNEEVNAVSKKSVINGVAVIETDDTRSGFVGSETTENEDGTKTTLYKSAWDGTELIKVFGDNGEEKVVEIDADGKFTVAFDSAPNGFTVVSPAEAWTSNSSCTIAKEQTPRENSVDPAVHVLQSQWTATANASYVQMSLQNACYGKMTIKDAIEIEQVKIDLKGLRYHSYEDTLSYTLNATNVKDNTFWFAIEAPMTVTEFTVTASCTDGKTLTKSVTIPEGRELKFNWGRVSTFSVSELEEAVAPRFTSASYNNNPSDKVVTLYSDTLGELWINFYGNNPLLTTENWINQGSYGVSNGLYFGSYYGQYKPAGHSDFLTATPNSFTLDVSIVDGMYKFVINADYTNMYVGVVLEDAIFHGTIDGLDIPDPRIKISSPEIAVKAIDSTSITFAWEPVEGAKDYTVTFEGSSETISACEYTISNLEPFTQYYIYVVANPEDSVIYKSSSEVSKGATTLPSPDMAADFSYTYDKMEVRAGYSNAYKFYNSANAAEYLYLQFNVDILTLAPGIYTYSAYNGILYGYASAFNIPGYPNGSYVEHWMQDSNLVIVEVGEYLTVTTYCRRNIQGYGEALYKSVWTSQSSEEDDDNTGDGGDDNTGDGSIELDSLTYSEAAANVLVYKFRTSDNSNVITIALNNQDATNNWIPAYTYNSKSVNAVNGNSGYFSLQYEDPKINGKTVNVNADGSVMKVTSSSRGGEHVIELTVVSAVGDTYEFTYKGVITVY